MNSKLKIRLDTYSLSHQNPQNQKIHKVAVPLIMLSLLGLLSFLKVGPLNAAWIFVLLASLYYVQFKNLRVYLIVYAQVIPMLIFIQFNPYSSVLFYLIVFTVAWTAQFIGHKIEGKRPSFLTDIQYLLIGPIWILFSRK